MTIVLVCVISFVASVAGAICGIGGGVIIKPVLDSFGILDVKTISFLSGCTVLAMSAYSIFMAQMKKESLVDMKTGTPMALGAAVGGLVGKWMFQILVGQFEQNIVGAVQAGVLVFITLGTLLYTLKKEQIKTKKVENLLVCVVVGLGLGVLSSFLGIGGGPINLVVLFYLFSMPTKTAAQNSIYIILFSQISSLGNSIVTNTIPEFPLILLVLMILGGIFGGMCGRSINKKMDSQKVERLFIGLMGLIVLINCYNVYRFLH